jgi:predicted pyridoxine 5'-phosphate oxidase superfamily flavin-nucleotide-binding protein
MAGSLGAYRDILDKKGFAHLATVGTDGRPQVTPVWVDFDGTHVRINTARGRVKDRNLGSNPRVASPCRIPTTHIATCRSVAGWPR